MILASASTLSLTLALSAVVAYAVSALALPYVQAPERTYPVGPLDKLGIDAGDVDGQRHRQDDEASG